MASSSIGDASLLPGNDIAGLAIPAVASLPINNQGRGASGVRRVPLLPAPGVGHHTRQEVMTSPQGGPDWVHPPLAAGVVASGGTARALLTGALASDPASLSAAATGTITRAFVFILVLIILPLLW